MSHSSLSPSTQHQAHSLPCAPANPHQTRRTCTQLVTGTQQRWCSISIPRVATQAAAARTTSSTWCAQQLPAPFWHQARGRSCAMPCSTHSLHAITRQGRDKYENEDLIKYGLPTDLWFHVDDMSSAHVYLRLPEGASMDDIPADTLEECAQLVKQNSIQGCKVNNVSIVYTPWRNLKKTANMDVGQVGFHSQKDVRKVKVEKKNNDIINRLERTRQELSPDFAAEKEAYEAQVRSRKRAEERAQRQAEKAAKEQQKKEEEQKSYKTLMREENMTSNQEIRQTYKSAEEYEEDFM